MNKKKLKTQIFLNVFFVIFCAIIIFPFILLVSISLSNEGDIIKYGYMVWPKHIDFSAYGYVLKNPVTLLRAYGVTTIFSVAAMVFGVLLMAMIAYPLTVRNLRGRGGISFYLYFTMLFNGGLVPTYILITQYLHLGDNLLVYILPGLISPWYVFMLRTFMQGIPNEMREAVKIDGGNEFVIFFKIILPLSKASLAAVALFVFLGKWNDWYTAMLYINNDKLISLQYMLQRILQNLQLLKEMQNMGLNVAVEEVPTETVRMALAVLVAGPALFVFPFFQKYFVRGVTVGGVKG